MINIISALQCEARPLIERYRLQGNARHSPFRCYQNDEMRLIVCGIGKLAAATATTYLAASDPHRCCAWFNIGIAGHTEKTVGEPLLANRLIDAASGQQWYPAITMPLCCDSTTLTTVDRAETDYRDNTMVDMEASGFYAAASRFQSSELIHALKIISDNRYYSSDNITETSATALIADNIGTIDKTISELQQLSAQLEKIEQLPAETITFIERWHFTTYQKNELNRLLRRWHALTPHSPPEVYPFDDCSNSKAVLAAIKRHLDAQPINFSTDYH